MSLKKISLSLFGLTLGVSLWVVGGQAFAATITVDDTSSLGSPATCSLTSAIRAANSNTAIDGCAAGEDPTSATDVVQLGSGTYGFDYNYVNSFTEAATLSGVGRDTSLIDMTGNTQPLSDFGATISAQTFTIHDVGFTAGLLQINRNASGVVHYIIRDTNLFLDVLDFGLQDGSGDITVENTSLSGVRILQMYTASYNSTFDNVEVDENGVKVENESSSAGDTLFTNSEFTGVSSSGSIGVKHTKRVASTAKVTIRNSNVTGYEVGLANIECAVPNVSFSVSTLYIQNSSIGGNGMRAGATNLCGHLVITDSTFADIQGSALLIYSNAPLSSISDLSAPDPVNRGNSVIESYNSTYTNIRPDGSQFELLLYGYVVDGNPNTTTETVALGGVVVIYTNTGSGITVASGSTLQFDHNTFAGNVLGAYSTIAFVNTASLQDITIRNNAFEGTAFSGSYVVSGANDVSNNLTTGAASPGIEHVANFFLGTLRDNGGISPLGINGRLGNVLTLRPLATSPLIDAAPSVGLSTDERNGHRSLLGAYDAGAVEVTLAEYTADGGIWPRPTSSLLNTGLHILWSTVIAGSLACIAWYITTRQRRRYVHVAFRDRR